MFELNHDSVLYFRGQLVKSDVIGSDSVSTGTKEADSSSQRFPAYIQHPMNRGQGGVCQVYLADNKFISAVLSSRIMFQELQ